MEHILLSRELEQEKIFTESSVHVANKIILRSPQSFRKLLEAKDCASVIIDELVLNQDRGQSSGSLHQLYNDILKSNPKCLIILLFQEGSNLAAQLKRKSHYTIFLMRKSLTVQKLDYIFTVHKHQDYRSLFTKDLRANTTAPIDLHIFHPLNQNYPCFIPKETEIKKEILDRLAADNVSQLFIKSGEFSNFLNMSEEIYHLFFSEEMHHIRKRYKYFLSGIIDDAIKSEWGVKAYLLEALDSIYSMLSNLIGKFQGPEQALKTLIFLRPNPLTQGLNSGIYAIVFTRLLEHSDEKELFYSALLYGLGKHEVPSLDQVRTSLKGTNLNARSSYLRYVDHSLQIVKNKKISLSIKVIENIKSHKEYYDGSGYPRGLVGDQIPISAQLLGIIESFNNLYTFRQNEKFLSFRRAWLTLKENSQYSVLGAKHSPKLLAEIESKLIKKGIL